MIYHVMADIETLGVGNNALPVVIGGAKFTADAILDRFEVGVDPDDAQRYGRVITGGTVMYWFDPKRDEARRRIFEIPKVDLASALSGFAAWCATPAGEIPFEGGTPVLGSLWGKGSTFDNIILRSAADATRVEWPFSFRQDECYRTLASRCPEIPPPPFVGTPHVAVDDAVNQAVHLQMICRQLGITL